MTNPAAIPEAKGRLGVMTVGLGAVATTFVAGVMSVRKGLSKPIGSLTQMGTIRLGKRTDKRSPMIKDFIDLAGLDDLVFGAWDIFPDNAYEAALKAGRPAPGAPRSRPGRARGPQALAGRLRPAATSRSSTARTSRRPPTSTIMPCSSWRTSETSRKRTSSTGWS